MNPRQVEAIVALIDGIATFFGFVGIFGFAIDSSKWPLLVVLLSVSVGLLLCSKELRKYR